MAKLKKTGAGTKKAEGEALSASEHALRNANDIVILLTDDEVIETVSVNPSSKIPAKLDHWCGRNFNDVLTAESKPKFASRLQSLAAAEPFAFESAELNHVDNANWEFPIRYTLQSKGPKAGTIMVGRDLRATAEVQQQLVRAQLALEKEYEKHRDFETRYRVLRDKTSDPILFVDATSGRILDANFLAAKLLGAAPEALLGMSIDTVLARDGQRPALERLLAAASANEPNPLPFKPSKSDDALAIRPTLFRSAGDMMVLCRIEASKRKIPVANELLGLLNTLYHQATDAIVFTDSRGSIRDANEGFLMLCDVVQVSDLRGKMLGDFLLRGGIDQKVLLETAARTGKIKTFATKLKSAHGSEIDVEISATQLDDRPDPYFGFVLRDRSRAETTLETADRDEAMQNAMELVGTAPLKELVAATADVVEKMCIETAVKLTDNNRVAAAELLGLSRQSFYVRLRKYGLLKKGED